MLSSDIKIGTKYRLSFEAAADEKHATLQYLFKPVSIAKQQKGVLSLDSKGKVDLSVTADDGVEERFTGGKHDRGIAGKDYECVLIKDGAGFKVRKIDSSIQGLRVQRVYDEDKMREVSIKESKMLQQSKKLPKFLQKQQPKKKAPEVPQKPDAPEQHQADIQPSESTATAIDLAGEASTNTDQPTDSAVGDLES